MLLNSQSLILAFDSLKSDLVLRFLIEKFSSEINIKERFDSNYSKALSEYKKNWSWEEMNGFLLKPSAWIKGNKMGFAGLKNEKDRASLIMYLKQNSDNTSLIYKTDASD